MLKKWVLRAVNNLSLKHKIVIATQVIFGLVIVVSFSAFIPRELELLQTNLVESHEAALNIVETNLVPALDFEDSELANLVLSTFNNLSSVRYVAVVNKEGELFAEYRTDPDLVFTMKDIENTGHSIEDDYLHISSVIRGNEGQNLGTIHLFAGKESLNAQRDQLFFMIGLIMIIVGLAGFMLSYVLQRFVSRPIIKLAAAARTIAEQRNYNIRVTPKTNDETGILYRSFNEMLDQIGAQNADIHHLNEKLRKARDKALESKEEALEAKNIAEKANMVKSQFLANMSHELRTPLNGILGYAQLLEDYDDIPERHREKVHIINKSGRHLLGLINDILDITKLEVGKMELVPEPFHLSSFLEGLYNLFKLKADKKGLKLSIAAEANVPLFLKADQGKIRQCLLNLISNAIKYTHQGEVNVSVSKMEGDVLQFSITDTGRGIPDEKQATIMEPFTQHYDSLNTEGGTGLGLAITKSFVGLLGGELKLRSTFGSGSTFYFSIPVEILDYESNVEDAANREIKKIYLPRPIRVLTVDSNATNRQVASELLFNHGFEVGVAETGEEALEKVQEEKYDLILMDIRMRGISGIEATQRIKKMEGLKSIPIIACTASVFASRKIELLEQGFDDYLSKPYWINDLLEIVAKYTEATIEYGEEDLSANSMAARPSEEQMKTIFDIIGEETIAEIAEAAEVGDFQGLTEILNQLNTESPDIQQFKKYIENECKEFNFEEIESLLNPAVGN